MKTCARCLTKLSEEKICDPCKTELLQTYTGIDDWEIAYQIELDDAEISKLNLDFDL